MIPKNKPHRNKKYLDFIRSHPCVMCGNPQTVPHHVRRSYWGAGMGVKPHDYVTLPVCVRCHDPKIESEILVERKIIGYLMEYIEREVEILVKRKIIGYLMEYKGG